MASIVPTMVLTTVEMRATISELRRAPMTAAFSNIARYQRNDAPVQICTLSLSLKEKTIRRRIGA